MRRAGLVLLLTLSGADALAQQSASHSLEEHVFNAGGYPHASGSPGSASHRLTLGSIGDALQMRRCVGSTFLLDGGFVTAYAPPGEIRNLRFTDPTTLVWDPDPSAGRYNVYRDAIDALGALGYGTCAQRNLTVTTATEELPVPAGGGFFFLVTVENRLAEQGTKGFNSSGVERTGTVCP